MTLQPLEVMAAKIGINMGLFVKLVESDRPLTTQDVASLTGGNVALLGQKSSFISPPLFALF